MYRSKSVIDKKSKSGGGIVLDIEESIQKNMAQIYNYKNELNNILSNLDSRLMQVT
jgi:hypothetical protein